MKTFSFILIAAYCFIGHYGFAQTSEIRILPSFTSIKIKDNTHVVLRTGSPQEVRVEAKTPLNGIQTTVEGNTLTIQGPPSTIYITLAELSGINISGIGKVSGDSMIFANHLRISISGNGKVALPIDVNKLEVGISGIGKLELSGRADQLDINISGSGKLEGAALRVKNCNANISGVGKCFADVSESLDLRISGSGSFYYKNKPAQLNTNISGIGKYGIFSDESSSQKSNSDGDSNSVTVIGHHRSDNDNYAFHWETDSIFRKPERARSHWAGFEIGFNQLLVREKFSTTLPEGYDYLELNSGKSINVNLNFFAHDFPIYKRTVLFTTGIGLTLNNYRFSSDKTLIPDTNRVVAGFDTDKNGKQINYEKNKLSVNYITLPLLLQFNTKQQFKKSFHIATGLLLSYKFNSHLKLVYNDDGDREKSKRRDEFNTEPFRYDATFRIGYEHYTLYASYAINGLFKDGRGPTLHPFQVGINLFGW